MRTVRLSVLGTAFVLLISSLPVQADCLLPCCDGCLPCCKGLSCCGETAGPAIQPTANRQQSPSPLERLTAGTRRFFGGVRQLFVPDTTASKKESSRYYWSGSQTRASRKEKKGWFSSLFQAEEPRKPQTVNEFLRQDRP
jgi:hypothetical protein